MAYAVTLAPAAGRDLKKCPKAVRRRLVERIEALGEDPRPDGAKALQGVKGLHRVREGDYRIIYTIEDRRLVVLVVAIGDRRDIYRSLKGRGR